MSQPNWKQAGIIGDVNPVEYGGGIVLVDTTGVYPPEVEWYDPQGDGDNSPVKVYRIVMEDCTYINGVLSDNKYHPDRAVWFADKLPDGITPEYFTSSNVVMRALAWVEVGMYYGFSNLDGYPLTMTRKQAEQRLNAVKLME